MIGPAKMMMENIETFRCFTPIVDLFFLSSNHLTVKGYTQFVSDFFCGIKFFNA